jgi:uncharacterized phage protein (TIGR02220 family)
MLAGSHTLGGHFLFKPLTIENMNNIRNNIKRDFTTIPNALINDNELTDRARFLFCYMAAKPDDWKFYQNKISKDLNLSVETIRKYISELESSGWLSRDLVRSEGKFDSYDYTLNGSPCRENTDTVKNHDGKIPTRENLVLTKEIPSQKNTINKKESTTIQIHDQIDKTKVVVHDEIKSNKQLQFVTEVVTYLNQKTNQQFKTTTKETIQFINSRVKLDGWELEDFKVVIDFKTNEWLKDDKMRQYLCPSTLFRASNAEKYLLAAKASKPKPPVKPAQLTKVHVEERPVLTQHDIEYSQAAFASVEAMFKQMGV